MFGLTFEKLLVIAVIAGLLLGPHRLARATRMLSDTIRSLRGFVEATRSRAEEELGMPLTRAEWESVDLRRYDPRVIVREALAEPASPAPGAGEPTAATGSMDPSGAGDVPELAEPVATAATEHPDSVDPVVASIRPGQRYLVVGDSAHPRRILLSSLPDDDPRRLAAERDPADDLTNAR